MKRSVLVASMLMAGAGVAQAAPMEVALLQEAIISGKTNFELRLRGEWVDDMLREEALAQTLRAVLGYKTGDYHGFKAFVEFENISNLGRDEYRTTPPTANTQYAQVADPKISQVNQAGLEGYGFKAGRQKLIYDNARFIGDVGWRQNDQTFDAISYTNTTLVPDLSLSAAYAFRVFPFNPNATTPVRDIEGSFANVKYSHFPYAKPGLFFYGVRETSTPAAGLTSWQHLGTRIDGAIGNFLYEVSYAQQDDYGRGTTTASPEADYTDVQIGYKIGPVTIKAQQETLEKGFKTPLATNHAFNGWSDRFTPNKPANGLVDTNLKILAKFGDISMTLAGYSFETEAGGVDLGKEVDFLVSWAYTKNITLLAKYAKYEAEDRVAITGASFNNTDLEKAWLQASFKF
ncbi:MAG: hypothetical protein K0R03_811 [Moraxellaceae bacterium]|nr:hypothetical protein [Moraxellaceae bacterium]